MHVATLFFWMITTCWAAQAPISQQIQPMVEQVKECAAQFIPETLAADMRSNAPMEEGKAAASVSMISYFTCRALAETNPLVCSQLKAETSAKNKRRRDQQCKSEYFWTSSILEVLTKKGDGVAGCRQGLGLSVGVDVDRESTCTAFSAKYLKGNARSMCALFPAGMLGSPQACERMLTSYDAEPKRCDLLTSGQYDIEICKTQAALLKLLRTKDAASCQAIAMCGAAVSGRSERCAPYAKTAGQAFCGAYVRASNREGKGGKYSSKQSAAIKAAQTKQWMEELKKQERARATKEEEESQPEP